MLSIPDMAILGAAALIFFGPDQLPKVARKVGLFMRDVQNTSQSFIREMERAADDPTHDISRSHILDEATGSNGMSSSTYDYSSSTYDASTYGAYDGGAIVPASAHAEHQLGMFDPPEAEPLPYGHEAAQLPFAPGEIAAAPPPHVTHESIAGNVPSAEH